MPQIELWVVERDGSRIAPLPDANLESFSDVLNGSGEAKFNIDPLAKGASEIEGVAREIQIWFDDVLVWWGVPWKFDGGATGNINVGCEQLPSLFTKRFVDRTSLLYTSIDQLSIGWNLLQYAQDESVEANRDFNISVAAFAASGVPRSRNYLRDEHKNILDLLKEFDGRTLQNGFDWEIQTLGDGSRLWKPYYPRKGALKAKYGVEWKDGGTRNLSDFSWSEDFVPLTTLAYVTGGTVTTGGSSFKKEGKYEDVAASAYWGQMQSIVSQGTELDQTWLDNKARQAVDTGKNPVTTFGLTAARTLDMDMFGNVKVGDWIPAYVDRGRIQVEGNQRIYSMTWNADNTLGLVFGEIIP